jgi:hypothetical protein
MKIKTYSITIAVAFALIFAPADAAIISYTLETTVDATAIGGSASEILIFDIIADDAPDFVGADSALYDATMAITLGGDTISGNFSLLETDNRFGADAFAPFVTIGFITGTLLGVDFAAGGFVFTDTDQTATDPSGLAANLDLSLYELFSLNLIFNLNGTLTDIANLSQIPINNASFNFSTSVIDVTPVPIPAALPLMLSGLFGIGLLRRRQKSTTAAT